MKEMIWLNYDRMGVAVQPGAASTAPRAPHAVDEQLTGAAAWVMGGMVGRTASYWERSVIGNAE